MEDVSHQRNRRRCVGADAPTCSDFFPLGWPRVPQHPRQRRRTDDLARVGQRGRGGASLVARPQDAAGARPGRTEQAGGTEPAPRGSEGRSPLTKRGLVFGKASGSASRDPEGGDTSCALRLPAPTLVWPPLPSSLSLSLCLAQTGVGAAPTRPVRVKQQRPQANGVSPRTCTATRRTPGPAGGGRRALLIDSR